MLILTRKEHEAITLQIPPSADGQTVTISLAALNNIKARIGIQADPSIVVLRTELLETDEAQELVDPDHRSIDNPRPAKVSTLREHLAHRSA